MRLFFTAIAAVMTMVIVGCPFFASSSGEHRYYFVAFDHPPQGLTWNGRPIEHAHIMRGDPSVSPHDAFDWDANGDFFLYGKPFQLGSEPYKGPRFFSIRYLDAGMTRLDGLVVVFRWQDQLVDDGAKLLIVDPMPDWLR